MAIRAVLFDVGGPLDTEVEHERLIDADIRAGLAEAGYRISDDDYAEANRRAVESFAWNTYRAIIWRLTNGNAAVAARAYQFVTERSRGRDVFQPRPGMAELLAHLRDRGLLLGLAANQPLAAIERLDRHGLGQFFHHREVSEHHGFRKPDPRLFLRACDDLGVAPVECVMVGDRIDNDIAPERSLGMRAVRLRVGRHRDQWPRDWSEVPDEDVADVPALAQALEHLLATAV